ncbi:M48 family metallopeptidase [Thiolapillus brandeum]|nr:M48 family metallopeptidase [Thiolapillus brandeum]
MIRTFCLLLTMTLFIGACSTSPTGRHQLMLVSPSQAIQASAKAYPEKLKEYAAKGKLNDKPVMLARVKRITGRLIAQAIRMYPESRNWEWEVVLIDDPDVVNAWCMAGGKMAIYSGLIEKLKPTDDELAQVMAHEISHALANHVAEQMSVSLASQLGLAVLSATALHDNRYRSAALTGAALAATLAIELPYSRAAEAEADRVGIEIAARAGYNPHAAVSLWKKMGQVNKKSPPELLNTHPSAGTRQHTLAELAPKMMKYYHPHEVHPVYPLN